MVGNGWMNAANDNAGALDTWYQRALIDEYAINQIKQACDLSQIGPLRKRQSGCQEMISEVQRTSFSDINIYDIYIDECHADRQLHAARQLAKAGSLSHQIFVGLFESSERKRNVTNNPNPCLQGYLSPYLNDPAVQKAIHARPTRWGACGGVDYSYESVLSNAIPIYQELAQQGYHILIYSGDVDAIVPYMGTRKNLKDITNGARPTEAWRAWHVSDSFGTQVGGFVEVYDRITFATVRDAGHEAPFVRFALRAPILFQLPTHPTQQYQPKRSYEMFENFIFKQRMPK